jgi:tRNA(Arg) A34 adenosine deaminase TadA
MKKLISILLAAVSLGCLRPGPSAGPYDSWGFPMDTLSSGDNEIRTAQDEIDLIYSLLAYAVVFKTWQGPQTGQTIRGHNYGAVLVNAKNELVHWGRNEVFALHDETQHAETRAIQQFLQLSNQVSLKGYTIYVGGDSCPMCAGMISQTQIARVVMGLSNPKFGKNFDRMNLDSSDCDPGVGLLPVVRMVTPTISPSEIRKQLDSAYRDLVIKSCRGGSLKDCGNFPSQTDFLKSDTAYALFQKASKQFLSYQIKFHANVPLYKDAVQFLAAKVN